MNKDYLLDTFVCEKDNLDTFSKEEAVETAEYIVAHIDGANEKEKFQNWVIGTDGYWGNTPTRLMTQDFILEVLERFPFAYKLLPDEYKTNEVKDLIFTLRPDYLGESGELESYVSRLVEDYFNDKEEQDKVNSILRKLRVAKVDREDPELLNRDLIKKAFSLEKDLDSLDTNSLVRFLDDLQSQIRTNSDKIVKDTETTKFKQAISLQSDDGQWYYLVPNSDMRDILNQRIHANRYLNGVTRQRGLNNGNRLDLHFCQNPNNSDDLRCAEVNNAKILTYADYERNPELQLELGSKLLQFYKTKNIPDDERALQPYNAGVIKRYIAHQNALRDDPEYKRNLWTKTGTARDIYQKDYLKNAIRASKKYSHDLTPIVAEVPRADDLSGKSIKAIKLKLFKDKLRALNPQDRDLFNRVQRTITGPFITTQSPNDLNLLINNYKNLAAKSNTDDELRDNWRKLQMSQFESFYADLIMYDLKEGTIDYAQQVLFRNLQSSGVYFSPTAPEYLANLQLFQDHWEEIPVQGRTNIQIMKDWDELVEKYYLQYYIPLIVNELQTKGLLDPTIPVDIDKTINNLKQKFNNVFEFLRYTKSHEKQKLIFNAITGEDLNKTKNNMSIEKKKANKNQEWEDTLQAAMDIYKKSKHQESKFESMIINLLKD